MRTTFKNPRLKSLLAIIILHHLETKIIQMYFILAIGVSIFWADKEYFVAYRLDLGLTVPGLYTYRIDETLHLNYP